MARRAAGGAGTGAGDASELERLLLADVASAGGGAVNTGDIATKAGASHDDVVGVLKSLENDGFLASTTAKMAYTKLTAEAEGYLEAGAPEVQVFNALPADGGEVKQADLEARLGAQLVGAGMNNARKNGWLDTRADKATGADGKVVKTTYLKRKDGAKPEDSLVASLRLIQRGGSVDAKVLKELKRRKLVENAQRTTFNVSKGPSFATERVRMAADLTKEALESGAWRTTSYKEAKLDVLGKDAGGGHLHPLLKVRAELRSILLEMGFSEMPTAKFVESSFWNFDSLFQPQSHPARDAHDTFFIRHPAAARAVPEDYLERVKAMHERGGAGSIGYRYDWKREEGMKNLLRTHTTAISSQMLYKLATSPEGFRPVKYFSIDRVFRNEATDATHLAEFHQVEGFIADRGLSLGDLVGVIAEFFRRLGITNLRFKPAYNPYTEPSMEVFGYHPTLKKWTEIGNSGIFRPEMLQPMGLPEDVVVIAWGLSLERPTMIKYGIDNIRDLFGHKIDLRGTATNPLARFDAVGGGLAKAGHGAPVGAPDVPSAPRA